MTSQIRKKRAMSSARASEVKVAGHINESDFAELIGGEVNKGRHTDKKDVVDQQHNGHSVKAGTWWQIFLYARSRLVSNTMFRGIGKITDIMIRCLDTFPPAREDYIRDKQIFKDALGPEMVALKEELEKENILPAIIHKAVFDGGSADYLSIYPGNAGDDKQMKHFHVFWKDEVVKILVEDITVANSKARREGETANQKVVLRSTRLNKQIGEIEIRNDSDQHYREMKFRLNGPAVLKILQKGWTKQGLNLVELKSEWMTTTPFAQVTAYGEASKRLKKPNEK